MANLKLERFNLVLPIDELNVNTISGIFKDEEGNAFKNTYYELIGPNKESILVVREKGNAPVPSIIARLIDKHEEVGEFSEEELPYVNGFLKEMHPEMKLRETI